MKGADVDAGGRPGGGELVRRARRDQQGPPARMDRRGGRAEREGGSACADAADEQVRLARSEAAPAGVDGGQARGGERSGGMG